MYNSDYIPLITGNKRITINRFVSAFSYSSSGAHTGVDACTISAYGVTGEAEVLLGSFEMITSSAYIADDIASVLTGDINNYAEHEYIRIQINSVGTDFNEVIGEITAIVTISELNYGDQEFVLNEYSSELSIIISSPIVDEVVGNWVA